MPRQPGGSSSPFYDADFASGPPRGKRKYRKRGDTVPISTRTVERWLCDRCAHKAEFPDADGRLAFELGWLQFDLGRSLKPNAHPMRERNEQILCPSCRVDLGEWFA